MASGTLDTTDPTVGGNDLVVTLGGIDLVIGGAADDNVHSGAGADIVVGDHAALTWAVRGDALQVIVVEVIHNGIGGLDTVFAEAGEDVVIGGTGDDDLDGGPIVT